MSKEHRVSDEHLKEMITEIAKLPHKVDYQTVTGIPVYNIRPFGEDSYRGQTLEEKPEYLSVLKEAGIERVVDLVGYTYFPEQVEEAGLEYHSFQIGEDFWKNPVFSDKSTYLAMEKRFAANVMELKDDELEEHMKRQSKNYDRKVRSFINEEFIPFIQTMQQGYVYIGCEYGKYKTDDALILNSYFNPKAPQNFKYVRYDAQINHIKNLYNNLTDEDKKRLRFTKEFDDSILPNIKEEEDRLAAKWEDYQI